MANIINNHGVYNPGASRFKHEHGNPRVILPESSEQANFISKPETSKRVLGWWYDFQYLATLEQGRHFLKSVWRLTFDHPEGPQHQVVVLYDACPPDTEPYPESWDLKAREVCETQPFAINDVIAARPKGFDHAVPVRVVDTKPYRKNDFLKVIRIPQSGQEPDEDGGMEPARKKHRGTEIKNKNIHVLKSDCFKVWIDSPTHFDQHHRGLYPSNVREPVEGIYLFAKAEAQPRLPVLELPPSTPKRRQRGEQTSSSRVTPRPLQVITPVSTPSNRAEDRESKLSVLPASTPSKTAVDTESTLSVPRPLSNMSTSPTAGATPLTQLLPAFQRTAPQLPSPVQPSPQPPPSIQHPWLILRSHVLHPGPFLSQSHHERLQVLASLSPTQLSHIQPKNRMHACELWCYNLLFRVLCRINRDATDIKMRNRLTSETALQWLMDRPPAGMSAQVMIKAMNGEGIQDQVKWAYGRKKEEERFAVAQPAGISVETAIDID